MWSSQPTSTPVAGRKRAKVEKEQKERARNYSKVENTGVTGDSVFMSAAPEPMPTIPLFKVFMAPPEELDAPVLSVLHSGYVTQGKKVEEFEEALRIFLGNPRALTVNSATSGLHLALHLLKKSEGNWPGLVDQVDEVLTCPLTCTATNWPILANQLKIKWVDADPSTCNMCLADLERKLSPTTKVVVLVHWGGSPIDLDGVARVQEVCARRFGFRPHVIEDCAHAFGAEYKGRKLGAHGNTCVFSLQAIKHLTSVDGGIVVFPNNRLHQRAKLVRWFGIDREKRSGVLMACGARTHERTRCPRSYCGRCSIPSRWRSLQARATSAWNPTSASMASSST